MENTVNNVSFRANIIPLTKIKDKAAFAEVKRLFEEKTQKNPKDILYISDGLFGENRLDLVKSYEVVSTKGINEQLESMGASKLAEKLVKIFDALQAHTKAYEKNAKLKSDLNRAKGLLNLNIRISNAWASEGKSHIAEKYQFLAAKNKEKIDDLTKEIVNRLRNFNKKIDKLSEQYEELKDLKFLAP